MRTILFLPLLLMLFAPIQNPAPGNEGSPVAVVSSKWARSRLTIDQSNAAPMSRRQFLCGVLIKPDADRSIEAFSVSGPSDVISVEMLSKKPGELFQEKVVINRVEYADGSIWQRKGWHLSDVRLGYERALRTPWGSEMCRGI